MKRIFFLLLFILTVPCIYAEPDLTNFIGCLPVSSADPEAGSVQLMLYDKPGFFKNAGKLYEFPAAQTFKIIEVSENLFLKGDNQTPFYKINLPNNEQKWIDGCNLLVVSTELSHTTAWYNVEYSMDCVQIYIDNGRFNYVYSKYDGNKYAPLGEPSADITKYSFETRLGLNTYEWEPESGMLKWTYLSKTRSDAEPQYFYMTVNRRFLGIKRILNITDEEFWFYYEHNDFDGLRKLLDSGYNNYRDSYITRAESPLIDSIEKRNFKMIGFLINNGFSKRTTSGNYDGTVSCLLKPVKDNDLEMVDFLVKSGVGQNIGGEMGTDYDLYYAVRYSHPEMVRLLINLGYDPNEYMVGYSNGEDSSGAGTFLNTAVYNNDIDVASVLLENGANPNLLSYSYAFRRFSSASVLEKTEDQVMTALLREYGAKTRSEFSVPDYSSIGLGLSGVINDDRVRFRDAPSLQGKHLGFFEKGEKVIVITATDENMTIGEMDSPWYLVRKDNGDIVWTYGYFVDVSRSFREF